MVALALVLPLAALVFDPGGLLPFGPLKWAAVSTVLAAGVALRLWAGRGGLRLARTATVLWLALVVLVVVAAVVGLDGLYAWTGLPERNFGVLTWALCALAFVAGQTLDDEGDGRFVVAAGAVTAGLLGAWAVAEALGWHPVHLDITPDRLSGPLGSPAFLGGGAALLLPVAVGCALDGSWRRPARRLAAAGAALCAVALVGSGARAAWLGAAVALALAAWLRRRRLRAWGWRAPVAFALAVLAVVGVGAALGVAGRVTGAADIDAGGGASRLDEWRVGLRVLARHPLTGVGPEGYRIAFAEGVDPAYERRHGRAVVPDRAHDVLLDVALDAGLPALAVYVGLIVVVGRRLLRTLATGPPWLAGAAAGLVAYLVQELFLFPVATLEPGAWLLAGLVVAAGARPGEEKEVAVRAPAVGSALVAAAAVVAAIAGGRDVAADRAAKSALQAVAAGHLATADREARRAVALRPDVIRYRLAAERAHAAAGTRTGTAAALADLAGALRWSPKDPVVRAERGRLLVDLASSTGQRADAEVARAWLARLVATDPVNAELQLRLGVADALAGDAAGAERAWLAAESLAPRSAAASTNLAAAYAASGRWEDAAAAARRALVRAPGAPQAQEILDRAERNGT